MTAATWAGVWAPQARAADVLVLACEGGGAGGAGGDGGGCVAVYACNAAGGAGGAGAAALATFSPCCAPPGGVALLGEDHLLGAQVKPGAGAAASGSGCVHHWEWRQGGGAPRVRSFPPEQVLAMAAAPGGTHVAAGGASGRLYLWDAASGELLRAWNAHYKAASALAFTADGSVLVSGGRDALVQAWSVAAVADAAATATGTGAPSVAGASLQPLRVWSGHTLAVTGIWCGAGDGAGGEPLVVSCSLDRSAKLWSLSSEQPLKSLSFPCAVHSVGVDPGEYLLYVGGADGRVFEAPLVAGARGGAAVDDHVYDAALEGHTAAVTAISFTVDGAGVVTASRDGTAVLWDAHSRQAVRTFAPKRGPVTCAVVVPRPPQLGAGAARMADADVQTAPVPLEKYAGVRRGGYAAWETAPIRLRCVAVSDDASEEAGCVLAPAVTAAQMSVGYPDAPGAPPAAVAELQGAREELRAAREEARVAKAEASRWAKLHSELAAAVADEDCPDGDA